MVLGNLLACRRILQLDHCAHDAGPVACVRALGWFFTTNFIWCVVLNIKNRSSHEYLNLRPSAVAEVSAAEGVMLSAAAEETVGRDAGADGHGPPVGRSQHVGLAPLFRNYLGATGSGH